MTDASGGPDKADVIAPGNLRPGLLPRFDWRWWRPVLLRQADACSFLKICLTRL